MIRFVNILLCCVPILALVTSQDSTYENHHVEDEEQLKRAKDSFQGIHWFVGGADHSNDTAEKGYKREKSFNTSALHKSVSDLEIEKARQDWNVAVERDIQECRHAFGVLREFFDMAIILQAPKENRAEDWAIYLASRLTSGEKDTIIFDQAAKDRDLGQLIFYADDLDQAPGCNMAVTAWVTELHIQKLGILEEQLTHVKAVGGDYNQLFWNETEWFDTGISYNKKTRSGFVVSYFYKKHPIDADVGLNDIDCPPPSYWQFLLPGFRNPMFKQITFESNLGEMVCLNRMASCDDWKIRGDCETPATKEFMHYNCFRSCSGCVRSADVPIDGGWSHWSQVALCSELCGGGFEIYYRFCTLPPAMYGGKPCEGYRIRKRRCRTHKCKTTLEKEKDVCHDLDVDCGREERKKYCDHPVYGSWMKFHCKKTCKVC